MKKLTPMMEQYMSIKNQYKDCILFFRLGDFYEMFFEDAITASRELEITLTQRDGGLSGKAAMCGVPHHVAASYVSKLVEKGYKVAICDQVEDPKEAKGIVKREVVRVVTPGTITDNMVLDERSNNYLATIYLDKSAVGISYGDNSTGEVYTTEKTGSNEELLSFILDELSKISPSEIICNQAFLENKPVYNTIVNNINPYIDSFPNEIDPLYLMDREKDFQFIDGLDRIKDKYYSKLSLFKLLDYLEDTQKIKLDHINQINYYEANKYMILDFNTRANLEIHETIIGRNKKGALIGFLDKTSTAMGGRLLKKWIEQPLIEIDRIERRQSIVSYFVNNIMVTDEIREILREIYDIERLSSKISSGNCNGREIVSLKNSISKLPNLYKILENSSHGELEKLGASLDLLEDVFLLIDRSIVDNPPISIKEGNLIKEAFNKDLDEIRDISVNGKNWLKDLEERERNLTGIKNLKVGYNRVSGYFIEVTKSNTNLVPDRYVRRQTLANAERYFTPELKEMEDKILNAEEKALDFEYSIFVEIRESIKKHTLRIQNTSKLIAEIDVLISFANIALKNNFIKPKMNLDGLIHITEGRHPVIENNLKSGLFVPNDTYLNLDDQLIQIITGPNMSGKSTYMRQIAVITLMAHIGSFVPATDASIAITDRIFTRIGAADNLSQGESTFMVEMNEVANIVKSASKNSLIILDEVGRGTSTYDGLSIAWALVEYIASDIKAKTLFATHYHELVDLENEFSNVKNLTILVEEKGQDIAFLRKIVRGSTNKSYGIQVAKLAGINSKIINRANDILKNIELNHKSNIDLKDNPIEQISFNDYKKDYFLREIANLNINNMTPMEAMTFLNDLVSRAKEIGDGINE